MNTEYLTRAEVAEYLKIGLSSADKIIKNRRFNGKIKVGLQSSCYKK